MEGRHFISSFSSGLSTNPCTISKTISQEHAVLHDIDPRLNDHCFSQQLRDMVNISSVRSAYKAPAVDAIKLACNWGIGIEAATKTIQANTQRGARTMLHPSLTRRRPTNNRFIRLRQLNHNLYGDLMKANVKSKRMNEHAHIFGADNGWCRAHPIRTKGQAPEALSTLFNRDGVPPALIVDGAKVCQWGIQEASLTSRM